MSGHCFPRTGNFGPTTSAVRMYFDYRYFLLPGPRGDTSIEYDHDVSVDLYDIVEDLMMRDDVLGRKVAVFSSLRVTR